MDIDDSADWQDYERDKRFEECEQEMLCFLEERREQTQNTIIALYPRLYAGVAAQEIKQCLDEAAYWLAIPDSIAEDYARDRVELEYEFDDDFWDFMGLDLWLEHHAAMYLEDNPDDYEDAAQPIG